MALEVMQALLDANKVDLPKALVEMEQEQLVNNAREELRAQGMKVDGVPFDAKLFEENARRRVTLGLILGELVRRHQLNATPEQVRALIEEHAQSYEQPDEVIKWTYSQSDRLAEFQGLVVEDNAIQWVLQQAKVVDQPVAFEQLMGTAA